MTGIGWLLFCLAAAAQNDTIQIKAEGRENSLAQQQKPYVILISSDGFRYDYAKKFHAENLLAFSSRGIRAASMIPGYPSLTFPNHYSLITGLYPSHHGLVNNYFYDRSVKEEYAMQDRAAVRDGKWYGGTPLWVLAEQQQMLTASFYWVGSEAPIQNTISSYYYAYNPKEPLSIDRRVQVVIDWLTLPPATRPHLITFYMSDVDHAGHTSGPDAPETGEAVRKIDSSIQKLVQAVKATGLPVNFIFVADHGMTNVKRDQPLSMPPVLDSSKFIIPWGAEIVCLYAKDEKDILPQYEKLKQHETHFKVYLRTNIPAYLHYGLKDDRMNRIGDIIIIPDWPYCFARPNTRPNPGAHGYDPRRVKDMHAVFYAWGPAFKNKQVASFENVNVFPVIARILGLNYSFKIDGTPALANEILK